MQRTPNRTGKTGKRKFAAGSPDASAASTAATDESPGESDKASSATKRRRSTSLTSLASPSNLFKPGLTERQQMAILLQMTDPQKQVTGSSSVESSPRDTPTRSKVHKRNERGETPLHLACIKGDVKAVSILIGQGAEINAQDFAGWTPLHEACNHGHLTIVALLLDEDADVNAMGMDGDTPLHDAASNNHLSVVKLLLEQGANVRIVNDNGKSALDVCGSQEVLNMLLAHLRETGGGENEDVFGQDRSMPCSVDGNLAEAEPIAPESDKLVGHSGPVTRLRNSTPVGHSKRRRISPRGALYPGGSSHDNHDLCKKAMKRRRLTSDLPVLGGSGGEESEEVPLPVRRPRILSSEPDDNKDGLSKEQLNVLEEEDLKLSFPLSDEKAEEDVKESNGGVVQEETDPPKPLDDDDDDDEQENGLSDSVEEKDSDGGTGSPSKGVETDRSLSVEPTTSSPSNWKEEEEDRVIITCASPVTSSGLESKQVEKEPDQPALPLPNLTEVRVKEEPGDSEVSASLPESPFPSSDQLSLVVTYPLELLKYVKNEKDAGPRVEVVSSTADGGYSLHVQKGKPPQPVSTRLGGGNDETHTASSLQEKLRSQSEPSLSLSKPAMQLTCGDDDGEDEEEEDEDSRSTIVSFSTSLPIVFSSRVQHPQSSSSASPQRVASPLPPPTCTEETTCTPTPPTLRPRNTPLSAKSGSQVYCSSSGSRKNSPLASKETVAKEQIDIEEQPLPPKKRVARTVLKSRVLEQRRALSSQPVYCLLPHNHDSFLSSTHRYRSHDLPQPINAKTVYPPIPVAMQKLFGEQEAERIALLAAHRKEVDRLVLCFEQELVRVHQRAVPKHYPPLSVCTVLTETLVRPHPPLTHSRSNSISFGSQHGDQSSVEDEGEKQERLLSGYVQDVWDKFHQLSVQLARRHRTEMETLWLSQVQIWRERIREQDGESSSPCTHVPPSHVPVTHFGNFPTYAH